MRVPLMEKVTFLFSISLCSICFSPPHLSSKVIRSILHLHYTSNLIVLVSDSWVSWKLSETNDLEECWSFPCKLDGCFMVNIILCPCSKMYGFCCFSRLERCYIWCSLLMNRYPIYTIPSQKNDKDMEACFLTYHTLSSSSQGILLFHLILSLR